MFISFFTGKVMLFYGISLIMKEKSNASALHLGRVTNESRPSDERIWDERRANHVPATDASGPRSAVSH